MAELSGPAGKQRRRLGDRGIMTTIQPATVAPATIQPALLAARRFTRSADLIDSVRQVDTVPSAAAQVEIAQWIEQVYAAQGVGILVGLFSHCYLGAPYADHALSLGGAIVEHYRSSDPVSPMYQPARPFALSEQYAYIEIYADGMVIPIRPDGSPAL